MPLERLPGPPIQWTLPMKPCWHPEHNPPSLIALEPGNYRHTCPGCGREVTFMVPAKVWA